MINSFHDRLNTAAAATAAAAVAVTLAATAVVIVIISVGVVVIAFANFNSGRMLPRIWRCYFNPCTIDWALLIVVVCCDVCFS